MSKPTEKEVHDAVRKLLLWAGDDPDREGLIGTPDRGLEPIKNSSQDMNRIQRKY